MTDWGLSPSESFVAGYPQRTGFLKSRNSEAETLNEQLKNCEQCEINKYVSQRGADKTY